MQGVVCTRGPSAYFKYSARGSASGLKSQKSFLDLVSTGSGSDLVKP